MYHHYYYGLSREEIAELERQIEKHKQSAAFMAEYQVSFSVCFNPHWHKCDMLTCEGEVDSEVFSDYIADAIASYIEKDFNLRMPEQVSKIKVSVKEK